MIIKFEDEVMPCKTELFFTRTMVTDSKQTGHNRGLSIVLDVAPYDMVERQKGYVARFFARLLKKEPLKEDAPEDKFQLFFDSTDFHCMYDLFTQSMMESVASHRAMWEQSAAFLALQKQLDVANEQLMKNDAEQQKSYQ